MLEEAQRRSLDDRLAQSNSDSEPEIQGDCSTWGCPFSLDAWGSHLCVNCDLEFCYSCSWQCYVTECRDGLSSGHYFCLPCLEQHQLAVHGRIPDDSAIDDVVGRPQRGDGPPSDGSPTTAPHSEAAPESDAPDTVFGDEETPGVGGTAPNPTEGEPRDGDTGGTGSVDKEVCQPCSPQPSKCPGICMGFLDGRCDQPCSRTKEGHNHCVCEYHDLELAVTEAAEAASGQDWGDSRGEWVGLLTRFTIWENYPTRRPVRYYSPLLANFDSREREEFWETGLVSYAGSLFGRRLTPTEERGSEVRRASGRRSPGKQFREESRSKIPGSGVSRRPRDRCCTPQRRGWGLQSRSRRNPRGRT